MDVLNDLLQYDKIEQGSLKLQLSLISVWQFVEKAILEFKLPATSKKIRLGMFFGYEKENDKAANSFESRTSLPEEIQRLRVVGDSIRLNQVLRNLMSNAIKFTPEGGSIDATVIFVEHSPSKKARQIKLEKDEIVSGTCRGYLKVLVRDSGAGMTPTQIGNLFRDGIQFNPNGLQKGGGTGLGLFIARGIVKQHDGTLSAASDGLGEGTTFALSLPIWDIKEDSYSTPERASMTESSVVRTSTGRGPEDTVELRVLVTDDVKSNRKLLCRLLKNKGHVCDEAEDGQMAVEMFKLAEAAGAPYDSVLMDYEVRTRAGIATKGLQ